MSHSNGLRFRFWLRMYGAADSFASWLAQRAAHACGCDSCVESLTLIMLAKRRSDLASKKRPDDRRPS